MTQPTIQQAMEAAVVHHQAGRLDQAEQIYRQVLSAHPNHPDALHLLGVIESNAGRAHVALQLIGQAILINPLAASYHLNMGVALDRLGRLDEAIAEFKRALAIKPNYPQAYSNLGNSLGKKGLLPQAIAASRQAIAFSPDLPEAHNNLGNALLQTGAVAEAVASLGRAVKLRPNYPEAYCTLAKALLAQRAIPQSIAAGRRAIELRADSPEAYNNLGNALAAAGQWTEATDSFRKAIAISPDFALGHFNLATMLLMQGDFQRGWAEYEWRFRVAEFGPQFESKQPRWDGSDLAGRRILIHVEQGLGDVIQFARYLPMVAERGGKIILRCDGDLHRLLASVGPIEKFVTPEEPIPEHDVHCSIISLPCVFKTTLANIPANVPYLSADPTLTERWRERIGAESGRKIGLVWAGRAAHSRDKDRSIQPQEFETLERSSDVRWFSLQKGYSPSPCTQGEGGGGGRFLPSGDSLPIPNESPKKPHPNPPPEYKERGKEESGLFPLRLTDWTSELTDFADTAALIANLDLIISVDTAIAHLAGAMGKTVFLLLPFFPDWRWMLDRTDSPWYPTLRLFRQSEAGDWKHPLRQIAETLTT